MTYLARFMLSAEEQYELGITDNYAWHKKIWDCFPFDPDRRRDFLTRVDLQEGSTIVWLLAERKPERPDWCPEGGFSVKQVAPTFLSHNRYAFDLRANPIKALVQRDAKGNRRPSKRVPLIKEVDLRAWIERKAGDGGFAIDDSKPLDIGAVSQFLFTKKGRAGQHTGIIFRGVLRVTDRGLFEKTYKEGIGSAKGFGFGLLLLAPID